ncbi:MAG: glycosyltransferase [Bacteroidales bacterium]|nr:glycosyltransferase [Bacteroidales bacterium]
MLKLSFILPCYNIEKYVERCVDSIYACDLRQTDYEIICVNDCSSDGSLQILKRLNNMYGNLRIVDLPHRFFWGGARNQGLIAAQGEYVWFVDSDDTICSEGIGEALKMALNETLDVLCFNYRRVDDGGKELSRHLVFDNVETQDGLSYVKNTFGKGIVHHMGYVWRFLYRRRYLLDNNLLFPEGVCWEDTVFMPETMLQAEKIASIKSVLYSYRVNPSSISGTFVRRYPANLIYEYAFCAGNDLLQFSSRIKDKDLNEAFLNTARNRYINGFIVNLCRTSFKERTNFYSLLRKNRILINSLKPFCSVYSKLLLNPYLGRFICEILSFVYSIKKWLRKGK